MFNKLHYHLVTWFCCLSLFVPSILTLHLMVSNHWIIPSSHLSLSFLRSLFSLTGHLSNFLSLTQVGQQQDLWLILYWTSPASRLASSVSFAPTMCSWKGHLWIIDDALSREQTLFVHMACHIIGLEFWKMQLEETDSKHFGFGSFWNSKHVNPVESLAGHQLLLFYISTSIVLLQMLPGSYIA